MNFLDRCPECPIKIDDCPDKADYNAQWKTYWVLKLMVKDVILLTLIRVPSAPCVSWTQRRLPSTSLNTSTSITSGTSTRVPTTATTPPRCPPCLCATWSIGEQSHCNCIGCKATEIDECRHNLISPSWSAALSPVPRFIIAVTSWRPRPGPRPCPPRGAPAPPATLPAGAGRTT